MQPFELRIAMLAWDGDGKRRPVLILSLNGEIASLYSITTQYENKSKQIKANYFPIKNWQFAGLNKPSYIDTNKLIQLNVAAIDDTPIGHLSAIDAKSLQEFLAKRNATK